MGWCKSWQQKLMLWDWKQRKKLAIILLLKLGKLAKVRKEKIKVQTALVLMQILNLQEKNKNLPLIAMQKLQLKAQKAALLKNPAANPPARNNKLILINNT